MRAWCVQDRGNCMYQRRKVYICIETASSLLGDGDILRVFALTAFSPTLLEQSSTPRMGVRGLMIDGSAWLPGP